MLIFLIPYWRIYVFFYSLIDNINKWYLGIFFGILNISVSILVLMYLYTDIEFESIKFNNDKYINQIESYKKMKRKFINVKTNIHKSINLSEWQKNVIILGNMQQNTQKRNSDFNSKTYYKSKTDEYAYQNGKKISDIKSGYSKTESSFNFNLGKFTSKLPEIQENNISMDRTE